MRQQHGGEAGEILGLVVLEPENLRDGEAGENGVAHGLTRALEAAELRGKFLALGDGGGVAPELGGADDFAGLVQRHKAMLLAADADGLHLGGGGLRGLERGLDGFGSRVAPGVRVLLLRAGREVREEVVSGGRAAEDLARLGVHDEGFGGLRAGINADEECSHRSKKCGENGEGQWRSASLWLRRAPTCVQARASGGSEVGRDRAATWAPDSLCCSRFLPVDFVAKKVVHKSPGGRGERAAVAAKDFPCLINRRSSGALPMQG